MKTIVLAKKVEDVSGLYFDLIKNKFEVENIGADQTGTHVFLSDSEEKDPTPIVDAWVGKASPAPTRSLVEQRKEVSVDYLAKRAQKEAEDRAAAAAQNIDVPPPAPLPLLTGSKQTLFSKIFRKLW